MRLLVVEDDTEVATFLVLGLREAGHVVEYAGNQRDALALAGSRHFDVILLDRMLPGGADGANILTHLRGSGVKTPALFLSGLGEISDWLRGLQAGGDDYMVKPIAMRDLLPRLEALALRGASKDSEAASAA